MSGEASPVILGRKACPDCGFGAAHIKRRGEKHPYRHCPSCGLMTQARSHEQAAHLLRGMRPEGQPLPPATDDPIVVPGLAAAPAAPAAVAAPAAPAAARPAAAPARPAGLWDSLMKGGR